MMDSAGTSGHIGKTLITHQLTFAFNHFQANPTVCVSNMCIDILKLIDAFPTIACNTIQMVMLARKCFNANVSCGPMEFNFQP